MTDLLDQAAELEQATRDRDLANHHAARKKLIPDIDANGNHYCLECGVQIPMARLRCIPDAVLCIDCQQLAELKERQAHG